MSKAALSILLVEDNPGDARLIRELLHDAPGPRFHVQCVERLAAALDSVRSSGVDIVLLDLGLPDSRGVETFTRMQTGAPTLPIIVLTGVADESLGAVTVGDGAQDYLVKGDLDGKTLARAIRYAIQRKHAEAEVRAANETLELRVLERTSELAATNAELEAFTYSVSHDLRAPIRQIDGFSRLLIEQFDATLEPKARHYLARIRESTQHMGRLVDDMLRLAQVGRQDVRPRVASLDTLVASVVADLQGDVADRDITWKIDPLPAVECDPGLMKVVLTNLVGNAVKYTRPRRPAIIEVGQTSRDGRPVIFVRDNGVGFDMRYADRLFGVFQRLHRAEEFEGTGVGLATVQRIVRKHGGEIWAEAAPDRGAAFYFTVATAPIPFAGVQ
jgi:signal transduction histidine kinase